MFNEIRIKNIYRTKKDDFENDFIIPILKKSKTYYRGTGYFNVQALINISKGLIPYIKNGGQIKLVISTQLNFNEIKLLDESEKIAKKKIQTELLKEINYQLSNEEDFLSMDLITNLLAAGIIHIKVAYLPDGGIYHEKIGYFEDKNGHEIFYIGSNNETHSGTRKNVETISVIKSWEGGAEDTIEQRMYFESLWNNNDDDIEVLDFPEAASNLLFSKYKDSSSYGEAIIKIEEYYKNKSSENNSVKELYPYQAKAIKQFCENKYCHFFEMATGTGKTFTAIKAIQKMSKEMNGKSLYVSVVVPQIDLQNQWKKEFDNLGIKNYCFGGNSTSAHLENDFLNSEIDYLNGEKIIVSIIIYDTFFSKINDKIIKKKNMNKLIVVDEAHELSTNQILKLTDDFKFRLGLSATPERHNPSETDSIIEYFTKGNIENFKYTIDEAIENNFLSRYEYYPIIVYLEDSETEFGKYQGYTKRLALLLNEKVRDTKKIQEVCNNRSLIVKKAKSKVDKIREMALDNKYDFVNSVVYCGQGKDIETEESIIDNVTNALAFSGNYIVSGFTSKTVDRQTVLSEFENGNYDTLVAIKCFDQGIDVPKLDKIYIMASDTTIRQTIQRRGRVLRKCKDTGKKMAYIYDMVTLPPCGSEHKLGANSLVFNELKRVKEYGRLAENKIDIEQLIEQLVNEYGIMEESDDEKEIDN